ncbi:hypothetical protein CK203_050367 [Vitis vinifera]|uniref:HAT C-terminal dimerisation domain-containing protein n=1 Tax=Vitis vinifera TaxID=29760 RepID=A0A438GM33_VITVI|nr:hypothetical protein CK203_050367 [Vitis vinifera]
MRKSQSVRYSDASLPDAPSLYKSSAARQKTVKNLFKGGAIKETMGRLISKFFIYESVPPSKADSHHFKNMIVGAQQAGMGIEPPSPYEIKHKYLDMEYKDMEAYVNIQEKSGRLMDARLYRWDRTLNILFMQQHSFLIQDFNINVELVLDPDLLQAVHEVFAKLDPTSEGFGDRAAIASRSEMVPAEWWFMYGHHAPTLRRLAIKVLSQTALSSACERNWSTFALIHTKQRNRLAYPMLQQLVFCYYNMKLKIHDMEAEQDKVAEKDYLDLLDIATEVGEEEDNQLFQWVRPLHLDDEDGNPDPRIAAHVREAGVDVDRVRAVTSRPSFDSTSVEHSSRPSATGTSASGYDGSRGEGTNDGSDPGNDEGDVRQQQQSGQPLAFTCEDDFTHCTQDEDHGSRRAGPGVGAIGKPYRGRQRRMMPYNEDSLSASFESMSVETQFSDSSNEANIYAPYAMSYGQPPQNLSSSTDEEYERYNYPSSTQMPYYLPHQLQQQGFQRAHGKTLDFLSMDKLLVGLKKFMHGMFVHTINTIETPCPGMNIVFNKMGSLHLTITI